MEIAESVLETYARLKREEKQLQTAHELRVRLRQWCHMSMYEMAFLGQDAVGVRICNRFYPEYMEWVGNHWFRMAGFAVYKDQIQYLKDCVEQGEPIAVPIAIYSHMHGNYLQEHDMYDLGIVRVEDQYFFSVRLCGSGEEMDFPMARETVIELLSVLLKKMT